MLSLKYVPINSFNENIVYLHKNCVAYKMDEIRFLTKVEVHGGAQPLYGFLQIVEDEDIVTPDEIGLNTEAFEQLNLPEGTISSRLSRARKKLEALLKEEATGE